MNWLRQEQLIPDGVNTMSKMPCRYVNGVHPKFIDSAKGAYCYAGDKKYIDYPLGLGPIVLGHGDERITQVVSEQMSKGWIYTLPNRKEGELAEKLCDIIPSFEKVRFLKSGTEACMAAVKIARAYTGKKRILCCGYHGWADWYATTTQHPGGCPDSRKAEVRAFSYNDMEQFEKLMSKGVAAVMMEPYIFEGPKSGFLRKIRKMCTEKRVLLIFDEVVTGFRTEGWTAQSMFKITPDLTCLGKAMANGLPISVVGGKAEIMDVLAKNTFVSSTFGGDLLGISAALETIRIIENEGVIPEMWNYGEQMKSAFNSYATGMDGVECIGFPCRTFFNFPTETQRSLFWQECLDRGVLFGYAQFVSQAHGRAELDVTQTVMYEALQIVKKYWEQPELKLRGECARSTLRLRDGS